MYMYLFIDADHDQLTGQFQFEGAIASLLIKKAI